MNINLFIEGNTNKTDNILQMTKPDINMAVTKVWDEDLEQDEDRAFDAQQIQVRVCSSEPDIMA